MPNGDVLVAETNAPARIVAGGSAVTNWIAGLLFSRAGAAVPSPNKLVLLRDADGDGVAEQRFVLRERPRLALGHRLARRQALRRQPRCGAALRLRRARPR